MHPSQSERKSGSPKSEPGLGLRAKDVVYCEGVYCEGGYFSAENRKHPGNVRYDRIIQAFREEYNACRNKSEKICTIRQIIATVRGYGGRFVTYDDETGGWKQLSSSQEREKVSYALRTAKSRDAVGWRKTLPQNHQTVEVTRGPIPAHLSSSEDRLDVCILSGIACFGARIGR